MPGRKMHTQPFTPVYQRLCVQSLEPCQMTEVLEPQKKKKKKNMIVKVKCLSTISLISSSL